MSHASQLAQGTLTRLAALATLATLFRTALAKGG
jgi:hypothetical protein